MPVSNPDFEGSIARFERGRLSSDAELVEAAAAMYETFRGERIEGLCTLTDRYSLLSPATAKFNRVRPF